MRATAGVVAGAALAAAGAALSVGATLGALASTAAGDVRLGVVLFGALLVLHGVVTGVAFHCRPWPRPWDGRRA